MRAAAAFHKAGPVLPPGGWHVAQGDMPAVGGTGPGRAAWGWAGTVGSVRCLPVFGLALHRAEVSWFVRHYAIIIKM